MRWSWFFLVSGFILFSAYIGWEKGAFDFKAEQMAFVDAPEKELSRRAERDSCKKETVARRKIEELVAELKEPLKSRLIDLIKVRKLDKAAALLEKERGIQALPTAYTMLLQMDAEMQTQTIQIQPNQESKE
jgi:hypothetical protein